MDCKLKNNCPQLISKPRHLRRFPEDFYYDTNCNECGDYVTDKVGYVETTNVPRHLYDKQQNDVRELQFQVSSISRTLKSLQGTKSGHKDKI